LRVDAGLEAFGRALPATPTAGAHAELQSELVERAHPGLGALLDLAFRYRVANADVHPGSSDSLLQTIFNYRSFMPLTKINHRFERTSKMALTHQMRIIIVLLWT
jgi:hypothetical protein